MARLALNAPMALMTLVLAAAPAFAQDAPAPAPAPADPAVAKEAEATTPESPHHCMQATGSRVTMAQNARAEREGKPTRRCTAAPGKVYTADDLDRTGAVNIADALRMLDTGIR